MSAIGSSRVASRALPHRRVWLTGLLAVLMLAVTVAAPGYGLPRLTLNLAAEVCFFGIASAGINLLLGYGGMLSLGSAGFLGTSAYTVALTTTHWHWPMVPAIVAGIALSMVIAAGVGAILVRLSQHYFAVAYLGLATAFAGLMVAYPNATGGTSGLTTQRQLNLGFATIDSNLGWYLTALVCVVIAIAVFQWAVAGRRGRIFKLVREDDLVASVLGVHTFRTRLGLFTLSAFFPALAGALLFPFQGLITPDSVGSIQSVQFVALVVIGGVGLSYGSFLGALIILWIQALVDTSGNYSLLVYGVVFLLCAFYLREGVGGLLANGWRWLVARLLGDRSAPWHEPSDRAAVPAGTAAPAAAAPDKQTAEAAPPDDPLLPETEGLGLQVAGVCRSFGGVAAIQDVSISLRPHAITALIGSNGAGKSTLVNVISGVERVDEGTVTLAGREITTFTPAQRTRLGIARTFQVPRLVEDLSVLDNVVLGREAGEASVWWRSSRREREHRALALSRLENAGLRHLAGRRVRSLGTGERKFVELVRALDEEPAVCLLDEPAVGLSLEEIDHLQNWIERLRRAGTAVLVIDHNLDFVQRLADYVYVMDVGRIVRSGRPEELLGSREARGSLLEPTRGQV
jgi:branched-chain amino acid transport system permease protein